MFGFSEYGDTASPCNIKILYVLIFTDGYLKMWIKIIIMYNLKFVKQSNLVNLSARLDNIFGCFLFKYPRYIIIRVDKMKECSFLNTDTIINTIIILNLIFF